MMFMIIPWQLIIGMTFLFLKNVFSVSFELPLQLIAIVIVFLVSLLIWNLSKRIRMSSGKVVIPEYSPPEGITPAMAAIILSGSHGWSETIIDLSLRGCITIEETGGRRSSMPTVIICLVISSALLLVGIAIKESFFVVMSLWLIIIVIPAFSSRSSMEIRNYLLKKKKNFSGRLEDYEAQIVKAIFADSEIVESGVPGDNQKDMAQDIISAEDALREKLRNMNIFEKLPVSITSTIYKTRGMILLPLILLAGILTELAESFILVNPLLIVLIIAVTALVSQSIIGGRLSPKGKEIRDHCLGLKLFLETTEKHKMKGITPDMFEKYLPYAIAFGIERKWAHIFSNIRIGSPNWYSKGVPGSVSRFSAFSPSEFSGSLPSSFELAIKSGQIKRKADY
ncbi:MAG: DUF2207 domain-containing protein [Candidatus Colwellbacteria bacterium]|nr:DUF2207 domain-containing protein [Candidatus Colwellbacteria bacterium]